MEEVTLLTDQIEPQPISFEEAPLEGTPLFLLDDQQEEIVFEEPLQGILLFYFL